MKAKVWKSLRLVGKIFPLLIGLLEKLALGLIKKLLALLRWAGNRLNRAKPVCETLETIVEELCDCAEV